MSSEYFHSEKRRTAGKGKNQGRKRASGRGMDKRRTVWIYTPAAGRCLLWLDGIKVLLTGAAVVGCIEA